MTFRPEFRPPWTDQPQVTTLALNRLDGRDRTVLVEEIAGGKALPDEFVAQIADRTLPMTRARSPQKNGPRT